jgi:hypothetical protein
MSTTTLRHRGQSCAVQPDQIEDVTNHHYLVRARVERLARLAGVALASHQS